MPPLKALPTAADVLAWADVPADDTEALTLAERHLVVVMAQVVEFTRGRGFDDSSMSFCTPGIWSVIVTATARAMGNPAQMRDVQAGSFVGNFQNLGFTIAEQHTLNQYRQRLLT